MTKIPSLKPRAGTEQTLHRLEPIKKRRIARGLAARQKPKRIEIAGIVLNLDERSVTFAHSNEKLFPQQRDFEILQFLVEASPRPVSRE